MKKLLRRFWALLAVTLMLCANALPVAAYSIEDYKADGGTVLSTNKLSAPIDRTCLSNGIIKGENGYAQIELKITQDDFTPTLVLNDYFSGRYNRSYVEDEEYYYHDSNADYLYFEGDLQTNSNLYLDGLVYTLQKLPDTFHGLKAEYLDPYLHGWGYVYTQDAKDIYDDDAADTTYPEVVGGVYRKFLNHGIPDYYERSEDNTIFIPENTKAVRLELTFGVGADYYDYLDKNSYWGDISHSYRLQIVLRNNFVPPPPEEEQEEEPEDFFSDSEGSNWDTDDDEDWLSTLNDNHDVHNVDIGSGSFDGEYDDSYGGGIFGGQNDYDDMYGAAESDYDDGSYASDFDDLTPGEAAAATAATAAAAIAVAVGAMGNSGGDGGDDGGGNGGGNGGGSDDNSYILRDPATGAETLYEYDSATGEWVSEDGRSVLDPERIPEWERSRKEDRKAADEAMKRLQNRDNAFDQQLSKDYNDQIAQEKRQDEINKIGYRHGVWDGTNDDIRDKLKRDHAGEVEYQEKTHRTAARIDKFVTAAEYTGKAADIGVDALATFNPTLKPIQYGYYAGRNYSSNLMDAAVNKKDLSYALLKAEIETKVDIVQSAVELNQLSLPKIGYKFLANTGGDATKEILKAIDEGKTSADDIVNAGWKGVKSGTIKTGTNVAFKYMGDKVKPTGDLKVDPSAKINNLTKAASGQRSNLLGAFQGGSINKSTYEGAKSVVNAQYVHDVRQVQAWAESAQAAAKASAESFNQKYDVVSGVVEGMVNDAATGNNPLKWSD